MLMRLWWLMLLIDGRRGFIPMLPPPSFDRLEGKWRLVEFDKPGFEKSRMDEYREMILTVGPSDDAESMHASVELHGSMVTGSICSTGKRVDRIMIRRPPSKTPHFKDMMKLLPKVIDISRKGLDVLVNVSADDVLRVEVVEDTPPPLILFFERIDNNQSLKCEQNK